MSEEEKEDILFQIDMQLYDEFNDTIATMNNNLGVIYSFRDVEEIEKAEKEKEIKLLREAIKKQQKEIEELKEELKIKSLVDLEEYSKKDLISVLGKEYISKDKIKEKIKELERLNKEQEIPVLKEYKFIRKEMIDYFKDLLQE